MLKKNLKVLIITSIVMLIPIVAGILLWDKLPEELPIHWNVSGEVDGWSSKPFAVIGMPLLLVGIHWFCVLATFTDPKKKNHAEKVINLVLWICPALSVLLSAITYSTALGNEVRVEIIIPVFFGFVLTVIGNYLPKCKQNYTVGIKLPWTLNSEENWNRTHRLGGRVMMIGGIATMISGFFGIFWFALISLAVMLIVTFVYSYVLHRKGI